MSASFQKDFAPPMTPMMNSSKHARLALTLDVQNKVSSAAGSLALGRARTHVGVSASYWVRLHLNCQLQSTRWMMGPVHALLVHLRLMRGRDAAMELRLPTPSATFT
jgi:hypothetical protein